MALTDRFGENNYGTVTGSTDGGASVSGQKLLSDVQSGRNKLQFVDKVIEISKNVAPMTALMMKLGKVMKFGQPTFKHLQDDIMPQLVEVDGTYASTASVTISLTTGHGKRVRRYDILYNANTDEQMYVSAVATDDVTVTRGHASTTKSTIANNAELQIFPSTHADGTAATTGIQDEPVIITNYLQIHKEAVELSGRDIAGENYGGPEKARAMRKALKRLKIKEEKAFLFGQLNSSAPVTTGGFTYWATTNVTNAAGALTEATLNSFIKTLYRRNQGQDSSLMFWTGELIRDAIDGFGRDRIQYRANEKLLGIEVGNYQNSHGNTRLAKHGLLSDGADGNAKWAGMMLAMNMNLIRRAEFRTRGLKLMSRIETPGHDGEKYQWQDDFGCWMASEMQHGVMKGVTG